MGEVKAVTDSEFESAINESEWVLVDFWAEWCGPCKAIAPILNDLASERDILVAKVDTDANTACRSPRSPWNPCSLLVPEWNHGRQQERYDVQGCLDHMGRQPHDS